MRRSIPKVLLAVTPLLLVAGCRKKPEPAPVAAATPPAAPAASARPAPAVPVAPRDTMEEYRAKVATARASLLETIYFEYDMDELRDDARAALDAKLAVLNANPQVRVRIAGHCDERGSDEYNIALGRRRAEAAKRYLVDRGIDEGRIATASFGRERPAMTGATEEAYSRNRRDEFEILAGGDQLRAP
jgi:peptidoglycan-associated lipoprotein